MTTVEGIHELPHTGRSVQYVRNAIDHKVLIHGSTGECYVRRDGEPWEHEGYNLRENVAGGIDRTPASTIVERKK